MKIPGNNAGPLRPTRAKEVHTLPVDGKDSNRNEVRTQVEQAKSDRVEISSAGRAKSAVRLEPVAPGTSERLAEVRRRVLTGAYDNNQVVGEVARRILDSGEA
jgi:hypothetical protein